MPQVKAWLKYKCLKLLSLFLVPIISLKPYNSRVLKAVKTFLSSPRPRSRLLLPRPRPRPRLWVSRPRPRLYFLSSRRLETKTLVSGTTSLMVTISDTFEDVPFLPKFSLCCFAIDVTITAASPYTSKICCLSFYVFRGLVANLPPNATLSYSFTN